MMCSKDYALGILYALLNGRYARLAFWPSANCSGEWRNESFIEAEQMFNPLAITLEGRGPIEPINGEIEHGMRFTKVGRHNVWVVKVCKGRSGWAARA
jgi:hypothetical protein